jgi:hypothetical protein
MAGIPTIPGTAQVQDIQAGVKRNPQPRIQALGQLKQTIGAGVSAIQEAASGVAEYEAKKQKAEEIYAYNMTSMGLQKLHTEFLHNVRAQPDTEIVPNWTNAAQQWKQSQMDQYVSRLSPKAKLNLNINLDQGIGEATAKFQVLADQLGSSRRESAAVANWNEFLKSGDPAMSKKAETALKLAVKAGDMTPEKRDFYVDQIPTVMETYQAKNMIDHAANLAAHKLDEGGFPNIKNENTRATLTKEAYDKWNKNMVGKYQDVRKQQEAGKIFTKKELNGMADREEIKGSSIKEALDAQGGEIAPEDVKANSSKVKDMILEIPKNADDTDRQQRITDIYSSKEYQALPNRIKKEFDGDLKAGKTQLNEIHRTQAEMMKQTFNDVVGLAPTRNKSERAAPFVEGGLKKLETMDEGNFKAAFGHNIKRKDAMEFEARRENLARQWYANAQDQYYSWANSQQGAKAKPAEAEAERVRLGFGTYSTIQDLTHDFQAGKIDRAMAKQLLAIRFGIE